MAQNKKKKSGAAQHNKNKLEEKLFLNAINKDRIAVFKKGENIGYTNATIVMLWLLHTQYGFGTKRLTRFLNDITNFCEAFVLPSQTAKDGEYQGIGLEDMCQALSDECDINIDWRQGLIDIDLTKFGEQEQPGGESIEAE